MENNQPAAPAPAVPAPPAAPAAVVNEAVPAAQLAPQIELSEEDNSNIETLVAMSNLPREQCIEAYIACERNCEAAANLLFPH